MITYRDIMNGELKTINRKDGAHALNNGLTMNYNHAFLNGTKLDITSKYNYSNATYTNLQLAGTGIADENSGYTYAYNFGNHKADDVFTGNYNSRYLLHDIGYERDWFTTAELTGKSENAIHNWRIGTNLYWNRQGIQASTGVLAHTIEKIRHGCIIMVIRYIQLILEANTTMPMKQSSHFIYRMTGKSTKGCGYRQEYVPNTILLAERMH